MKKQIKTEINGQLERRSYFPIRVRILGTLILIGLVASQIFLVLYFFNDSIFNKLIFRKSSWHGYNPSTGLCLPFVNSDGFRDVEFYEKKPGEYLILVIGDSVVYGQGLLTSQRFTNKLQRMLNRIRPTRVFNLGECGANLYQNYLSASRFKNKLNPDLAVITFIGNDLLVIDGDKDYPKRLEKSDRLVHIRWDAGITPEGYTDAVLKSFDESTDNWKMLMYLLPKLPKLNTLYSFLIIKNDEMFKEKIKTVSSLFEEHSLRTIDTFNLLENKYKRKNFKVSSIESHPNAQANQMFAERLYQEITSNPKYGFIHN